jgi:hypothetical protein
LEVLAKFNSLSQTSMRCVSLSHSSSRSLELDFSMLTKRALWWLVDKGKMVKMLADRGFWYGLVRAHREGEYASRMGERTREDGKEIREMRGSQHGDVDRGVERGEVNVV